jgi:hypothetical protein
MRPGVQVYAADQPGGAIIHSLHLRAALAPGEHLFHWPVYICSDTTPVNTADVPAHPSFRDPACQWMAHIHGVMHNCCSLVQAFGDRFCCDAQAAKQSNTTEGLVIARLHRSLSHNKHYHIYDGAHLSARPLNHVPSITLLTSHSLVCNYGGVGSGFRAAVLIAQSHSSSPGTTLRHQLLAEWETKGAYLKHMAEDPGRRMFARWCEVRHLACFVRKPTAS